MQRGHVEDDPARAIIRERTGRAPRVWMLQLAVQLRVQPEVRPPHSWQGFLLHPRLTP